MKALFKSALLAGLALALSAGVSAADQSGMLNFGKLGGSRKAGGQQPTVITADSMDIDIANNVATLVGNVEVDDVEMNIKCHKMIIYLEDVKKESKEKDKDEDLDPEKSKQLRKIECIGDVVITRKVKVVDAASGPGSSAVSQSEQKALAGRADYEVSNGKIVLSEDPVIFHGKDKVLGKRITIYRESEKMEIVDGRIETTQSASEEKQDDKSESKPSDSASVDSGKKGSK